MASPSRGTVSHTPQSTYVACRAVVAWLAGLAFALALPAAATEDGDAHPWVLTVSQLQEPLRPLWHLSAQEPISVHSAVVTVADPTETHLGRIFDVGLAAIISGFQSQDYVLDGYALDWHPSEAATTADKQTPTQNFDTNHRQNPGLLMFRYCSVREPSIRIWTI